MFRRTMPSSTSRWTNVQCPCEAPHGIGEESDGNVFELTGVVSAVRTQSPQGKSAMTALGVIPWTARARTWTVVSIGSAGDSILGYPRRAWRGKGFWLSHVEPANRERLVRCWNEAADRERPTVCEYRFTDAQGGILWLRSAVTWRSESPGKVSGFHIDVTAEREAQPVVSLLDEQYRYALDVAGVAIWQRGADDLEGWVHPAITALAGLPADARVSFTEWLDRVHPRDRDRTSEHASHACFSGPVTAGAVTPLSCLDYRVRHVDGSIRWLSSTIATVASADGSDVRIFGTIADVTERVRERRARRAAERLYRDVWQSFPGSAAVLDRAGVIVEVNPMWESLVQQREADHGRVGANYLDAARKAAELGDEFAASTADGISAVLAGTSPQFTQDFASTNSGDEERWYRMRVLPLHRPSRGAIVLHDDITERVVAERATQRHREDLTHMQRLATLGELATSIAHELNQPLAAIMASASTARRILRDRGDVEPLKPVVNDILESAARAADVVRRARAMVRHDTSVLENVSINEVVSAVSRLMASDLVIHQVSLKLELDQNARPVIGDHIQLQQVLLNL